MDTVTSDLQHNIFLPSSQLQIHESSTTFAKRISADPLAQQTEQTVPKVIIRKPLSASRKNQCPTPTKEDVGVTESSDKIVAKRRGLDALEKAMEIETTRSLKDCKIPNEDGRIAGLLYKKEKRKIKIKCSFVKVFCATFVLHCLHLGRPEFPPKPILLY